MQSDALMMNEAVPGRNEAFWARRQTNSDSSQKMN